MQRLAHDLCRPSFDILYNRYFNKLVYFAYGMLQDQSDAEDMVHDSFLGALKSAKQFDPQQKFSTWIYTLVKNRCLNHLQTTDRREKLLQTNFKQPASTQNHIQYDARLIQQEVQRIKQALSEKEQLVYQLRMEQELSIKEIALIADIPEGSVKSCLYYTLKKIASQLKVFTHE
jgi:RNA polymerase sigma-70 factor, ECF subfamily